MELEAQHEWLRYREIQASGSSLSCCLSAVGNIHANHALQILRPQRRAFSFAELSAHVRTRLRKHQAFEGVLAWQLSPLQSGTAGPQVRLQACALGQLQVHAAELKAGVGAGRLHKWPQHPALTLKHARHCSQRCFAFRLQSHQSGWPAGAKVCLRGCAPGQPQCIWQQWRQESAPIGCRSGRSIRLKRMFGTAGRILRCLEAAVQSAGMACRTRSALRGGAQGQRGGHARGLGTGVGADLLEKWPQQLALTLKRAPGSAVNVALPSGCNYINQDGLQDPQCPCEEVHKGSGEAMPEDWAQESALIGDCTEDVLRGCANVTPGYARMYTCLQ